MLCEKIESNNLKKWKKIFFSNQIKRKSKTNKSKQTNLLNLQLQQKFTLKEGIKGNFLHFPRIM